MCRLSIVLAALASMSSAALANLTGIPLQFHAIYDEPPDPGGLSNQGGSFTIEKNELGYDPPRWLTGETLHVDNQQFLENKKDLWLEIDYKAGFRPAVAPNVIVSTGDPTTITSFAPVAGADDWTYHWLIVPQPRSEVIQFPNVLPFLLQGNIERFEIGTNCMLLPEPAVLSAMTVLLVVRRRRG
jgi:hypothetical protein